MTQMDVFYHRSILDYEQIAKNWLVVLKAAEKVGVPEV
jgi:hypothetical protein